MEQAEIDYRRTMGLDYVDIGSRRSLLREVIKLAKQFNYGTGDFHSMPRKQLYAIFQKLNSKKCHQ